MYTPRARVYRAQTRFLSLSYGSSATREPAELNESSRIDGSGPRGALVFRKPTSMIAKRTSRGRLLSLLRLILRGVATGTLKILMNHPFSRLLQ